MMTEQEFKARWEQETPIYKAWGDYVRSTSIEKLRQCYEHSNIDCFFKVPVIPRIKNTENLIQKAFRRKKGYQDPYSEITDKVGIRFVLLTLEDVTSVCQALEDCTAWTCSKHKDFLIEQNEAPALFAYQSMHYVVSNSIEIVHDGCTIPAATPCEIQVRTLLQHTLAELTHDITYKPKTATASSNVLRMCARAGALVEIADEIFIQVVDSVREAFQPLETVMVSLSQLYNQVVEFPPEEGTLNSYIMDAYHKQVTAPDLPSKLHLFYSDSENTFILPRIQSRRENNVLYRQAAILLIYYLVKQQPNMANREWPLSADEIAPIYHDLGKQIPFV